METNPAEFLIDLVTIDVKDPEWGARGRGRIDRLVGTFSQETVVREGSGTTEPCTSLTEEEPSLDRTSTRGDTSPSALPCCCIPCGGRTCQIPSSASCSLRALLVRGSCLPSCSALDSDQPLFHPSLSMLTQYVHCFTVLKLCVTVSHLKYSPAV